MDTVAFRKKKGRSGANVAYPITSRRARPQKPSLSRYAYSLHRMISSGVMNADLRSALFATLDALNKGDLELAYELSAVKSYIVSEIDPKDTENHFQEESKANEKIFGRDIYSIMDSLHHDIAMRIDKIPSGATIFTSTGVGGMPLISGKGPARRKHPVIEKMEQEHERIEREAREVRTRY